MKTKIIILFVFITFSLILVAQSQNILDYKGPCTGSLEIIKFKWHKDGFGTVCIIDSITIKNNSSARCKDLLCFADFYGASKTHIGAINFKIYNFIPAGKTKTFYNINAGLLPSPSDQIRTGEIQILSGIAE